MEKVLLDTNIYIYLEDNKKIAADIIEIAKILFDSEELKIVIHPKTFKEIKKYPNDNEREIFLSKISVFPKIDNPPIPPKSFHKSVGVKSENDIIDNEMLYAVRQNCVKYLITNDNSLISKGRKICLGDRVLSVKDAIEKFSSIEKKNEILSPSIHIKYEYLYNIDIDDPFFESLKDDYPGFAKWFARKQENNEKAYITRDLNGNVTSFLLLKLENENEDYSDFEKPFAPLKRLKVSTFKVQNNGKKIGEAFIKIIIQEALINNASETYLTVFPKHLKLIELLIKYGFVYYCAKKSKESGQITELIYVKKMDNSNDSYPYLHFKDKNIFIAPVQPDFHRKLFPEAELTIQLSFDDVEDEIPVSNSIEKVYISNSSIKKIKHNDIILFYASGNKKAITTLGVVDTTFTNFKDFEELEKLVRKRTAYHPLHLRRQYKSSNLVILFKHYWTFPKPVSFKFLLENNIVSGNIQSIQSINKEKFKMIVNECKINKDLFKE